MDRTAAVSHLPVTFGMLAYDAATHETVEFDGPFAATWVYAAGLWRNITGSVAPPPRVYGMMSYDSTSSELVLFGGIGPHGGELNDTWIFDGGIWKNASPAVAPPVRYGAGFANDPHDGGAVLFGGFSNVSGARFYNDTWVYAGPNGWKSLPQSTSPPAVAGPSLTYDSVDGVDVLFGGIGPVGSSTYDSNQTWVLNSSVWANRTVSGPSGREFPAASDDPALGGVVLFGGERVANATASYLNDTWTYHRGTWTLSAALGPSPSGRVSAGFAWDSTASRAILVGGLYGAGVSPNQLRVDSWAYGAAGWSVLSSSYTPSPRFGEGFSEGPTPAANATLFGGYVSQTAAVNDTWSFVGNAWQDDVTATAPPGLGFPALAQNPASGEMVLFGGRTPSGTALNETWTYAGGWANRSVPTVPPARYGASFVYDPATGSDVLFGGITTANVALNDTWSYAGGVWSKIGGTVAPPARAFASATWDPAENGILLFGGSANGTTFPSPDLGDTWVFANGSWSEVVPSTAPTARIGATLTFDPRLGEPVLFGGWSTAGAGAEDNDTWTFSAGPSPAWVPLLTHAAPAPSGFGGSWWDPASNATWLYGGASLNRSTLNLSVSVETRALDLLGAAVSVSGTGGPTPYVLNFSARAEAGGGGYGYSWTLLGATSSAPVGSFTVTSAGSYTLFLNITDAWGVVDRMTFPVSTFPGPLSAEFTATPLLGTAPLNVTFLATAVGGDAPFLYAWTFGDGATAPMSGSPDAIHRYIHNGTFVVTLTVTDATGTNRSANESVTLVSRAPFGVTAVVGPTSGTAPLNVTFSAIRHNGSTPFGFAWSFGDGGTAAEASGSHVFAAAGNYTVVLNATDGNGTTVLRTFAVHVLASPPEKGPVAGGSIPWWAWVVVVALVVVAVIAVLAWRRRGRPSASDEPTPRTAVLAAPARPALAEPPARPPAWDENDP